MGALFLNAVGKLFITSQALKGKKPFLSTNNSGCLKPGVALWCENLL